MKNIVVLSAILLSSIVYGQTKKVKGALSANTADLTILNIYPDSFPDVSVVFKAEARNGEPVWGLKMEDMVVKEDSAHCKVLSIEPVSVNKPINIGIVIDHSGSMEYDGSLPTDSAGNLNIYYDSTGAPVFPKGYIAPLDNAKQAIRNFVKSFNYQKDFISVIGFSDRVDKKLKLTHDVKKINAVINSMHPDYSTALYDAMLVAIKQIKKADGVRALVVLTDGQDNSSSYKYSDVIKKANKEDIPIYIIGLGDANKDTLNLIAKSTNGDFFYTRSPASLNRIYKRISKDLQAFYDLVYASPNLSIADSSRKVEISFNIDSLKLYTRPLTAKFSPSVIENAASQEKQVPDSNTSVKINVPQEVTDYIEKKDKQKQIYLYGGIALLLLISAGTLLYVYNKRNNEKNDNKQDNEQPVITNLFPNPTNGPVTITYTGPAGQLQILSFNGQVVHSTEISGTTKTDFGALADGEYMAIVIANGVQSNVARFIVKK